MPEPFSQGCKCEKNYCGGVVLEPVPVLLPVPVPLGLPLVLDPEPVELPVLLLPPMLLPLLPMFPELSFVLILQVSESIFTSVTLKVPLDQDSLPEELAVGEELEFDALFSHVPFRVTSCPT